MSWLILLPLLVSPTSHYSQNSVGNRSLAISNVTVIDCTGKAAQPAMTVLIRDDRIVALGNDKDVRVPQNTQLIDGTGKFLIPGLWDMHVHWYDTDYLPLFHANGVTGVRIMWGFPINLQWRKDQAAGALVGPRLVLAGPIVDGPKPIWPGSTAASTEAEGREAVRKTKKDGYDFVKVYSLLPRDVYFAIADEAKKQHLPFVGHVPSSVSVAEASDAGQKSMEHLYGILLACSSRELELTRALAEARKIPTSPDRTMLRRINEQLVDSYDTKKAASLFAKLKANGTWQVPTLTVLRSLGYLDDPAHTSDPRLKYMPRSVTESWNPKTDFRLKSLTKEDFAQQRKLFERNLELVGAMHAAGVGILAGTDVLNPYCFPGFSIHDELNLLVKAHLTPLQALQTATRDPARFLGEEKDAGTVEQGKRADLVMLDANPLLDIKNTTKIEAVIVAGKLLPRERLNKMLADVEALAAKK